MRRFPSILVAVVAAVAASGSPAAARSIGDVRTIGQLGTCMYISHKATALDLLNASTAGESDRAVVRLRDEQSCFDRLPTDSHLDTDVAAFSKGLMRGLVAEAALRLKRQPPACSRCRFSRSATSARGLPPPDAIRPWMK